jgi:hypothetical protein
LEQSPSCSPETFQASTHCSLDLLVLGVDLLGQLAQVWYKVAHFVPPIQDCQATAPRVAPWRRERKAGSGAAPRGLAQ